MKKIVIFGGTVEGRELVEKLTGYEVHMDVCVVTDYAASLLPEDKDIAVYVGRMDADEMACFLKEKQADVCVDATHPYAVEATKNIKLACDQSQIEYLRLSRNLDTSEDENQIWVENVSDAVSYLETTKGKILVTTGSKELGEFTKLTDYKDRVIARVLPTVEVMNKCAELGFEGAGLICMQGPFSVEMNEALLKQTKASYMVTKCTGQAGGFPEKCQAAKETGVTLVVIGKPEESVGASFDEVLCQVTDGVQLKEKTRTIFLIGMGPGGKDLCTKEATKLMKSCDLLVGANRLLTSVDDIDCAKLPSYMPKEILDYITANANYSRIGILYSGDIGFYSGAKKMYEELKACSLNLEIKLVPGISSVMYLLDRLGISWEDAKLVSNHGRQTDMVGLLLSNKVVASLLGASTGVADICKTLVENNLGHVRVTIGEKLSYPEEKIVSDSAEHLLDYEGDSLAVAVFENDKVDLLDKRKHFEDSEFIRGAVPMTKEEVRALVVAKLGITDGAICYDVGAGTGSVSIEMAKAAGSGMVYAIEHKAEAIDLLEQNKKKFNAYNMTIVEGHAPEALEELPAPEYVFVGGSSGRLVDIIRKIREKNINAKFVVTAVTMETIMVMNQIADEFEEYKNMSLVQVQISRSKTMGEHHLMHSENGIFIASFGGHHE